MKKLNKKSLLMLIPALLFILLIWWVLFENMGTKISGGYDHTGVYNGQPVEENVMSQSQNAYSLHYKMIVTVETPEGDVSGYAVREIGNSVENSFIPEVGNPGDVGGEAVVVDLGKRGVLFALISHKSDLEFYNAFPVPGRPIGNGGATPEGIKYYASLPIGAKGVLNPAEPPGYPKLVTFTDMNDPKSITETQIWERQDNGKFYLKEDFMARLFGESVRLKSIEIEITKEPVTWGTVDKHLPKNFSKEIKDSWRQLSMQERGRISDLVTFKQGGVK
ncbi:MAG: hypothetical protein ACXW4B_06465 [Micavibrio sp.]